MGHSAPLPHVQMDTEVTKEAPIESGIEEKVTPQDLMVRIGPPNRACAPTGIGYERIGKNPTIGPAERDIRRITHETQIPMSMAVGGIHRPMPAEASIQIKPGDLGPRRGFLSRGTHEGRNDDAMKKKTKIEIVHVQSMRCRVINGSQRSMGMGRLKNPGSTPQNSAARAISRISQNF